MNLAYNLPVGVLRAVLGLLDRVAYPLAAIFAAVAMKEDHEIRSMLPVARGIVIWVLVTMVVGVIAR